MSLLIGIDIYNQTSLTMLEQKEICHMSYLVMQRYIVQTIYRFDIGHIVSYRYRQGK